MATGIKRIADRLEWVRGTHGILSGGKSSYPIRLGSYLTKGMEFYFTSPGTDGSNNAESLYMKMVLTGAGQVGGRARFHTYTNVAVGAWVNAIKGHMEFGAAGRTTGLASAICAEMTLPNQSPASGEYFPMEVELIGQTSSGPGVKHGFLTCRASGVRTNINASGYFMDVEGLTAGTTAMLSANSLTLKCSLSAAATVRYMLFSQFADTLSIGLTGAKKTLITTVPEIVVWSTSALTSGTQDIVKIDFTQTQAATAGYIKGLRCTMTANVKTPASFNGVKGIIDYATNGYVHGDCAPLSSELVLGSADVISRGQYYGVEAQIGGGNTTGNTNNNPVAFYRAKAYGNFSTIATKAACYLFHIEGIAATNGGLWEAEDVDAPDFTHALRIKIDATDYWIGLSTTVNFSA